MVPVISAAFVQPPHARASFPPPPLPAPASVPGARARCVLSRLDIAYACSLHASTRQNPPRRACFTGLLPVLLCGRRSLALASGILHAGPRRCDALARHSPPKLGSPFTASDRQCPLCVVRGRPCREDQLLFKACCLPPAPGKGPKNAFPNAKHEFCCVLWSRRAGCRADSTCRRAGYMCAVVRARPSPSSSRLRCKRPTRNGRLVGGHSQMASWAM